MLNVSEAVKTLYKSSNAPITLQLRIGNTTYTDRDVVAGSMSITESLCSLETFDLSTVEKNELVFSLFNEEQEISDLIGQTVVASHIVTLPNSTTETVPLGTYTIVNAVKDGDYIFTCTCYDGMLAFDKVIDDWWNTDVTFPITLKDLAESLFDELSVQYSLPVTFVNSDFEISVRPTYFENIKASEVLGYIQEVAGGFFKVDRLGTVRFYSARQLTGGIGFGDNATVVEYSYRQIFGDLNVADYDINKITALQIRGTEDDVGIVVGTGTNVFIIEGNPLLYNVTEDDNQIALNILNAIKDITYTPFSGEVTGLPYVEFGDCVHAVSYKNTEVTSPIFYRVLNSQRLSVDSFTTKGEKQRPVTKTLNRVIKVVNQKTHELVNTVETLSSTITQVETDLSGQIAIQSTAIQQNANAINLTASRSGIFNLLTNSDFSNQTTPTLGWTASYVSSIEYTYDEHFIGETSEDINSIENGNCLKITLDGTNTFALFYQSINYSGSILEYLQYQYTFRVLTWDGTAKIRSALKLVDNANTQFYYAGSTAIDTADIQDGKTHCYRAVWNTLPTTAEGKTLKLMGIYFYVDNISGTNVIEINHFLATFTSDTTHLHKYSWTDYASKDLISQINLAPTGLRINANKIIVDTSSLDLTFGSELSHVTIKATDDDDGVFFDGTGKVLFRTNGEFWARNLDSSNHIANHIRMRSGLISSSNLTYNQISLLNKWNDITSNELYANAFDSTTEFWLYNNRPGALKNANNHYMGVTSTAYINRLYNYKYNSLTSSGGIITANNLRLEAYSTYNYATLRNAKESGADAGALTFRAQWESGSVSNRLWLENYHTGSTNTANNAFMYADSSSNYLTLNNNNSTGTLANQLHFYRNASQSIVEFYNNNSSAWNMNFIKLHHYPTNNWNRILIQNEWNDKTSSTAKTANWIQCSNAGTTSDFQFYNYHNNGNLANTFFMTTASNSGRLELTNRNSSGTVQSALYMYADGKLEISTITGGSQRITMNKNGNLDVVGNNVVYLGITQSGGYLSVKTRQNGTSTAKQGDVKWRQVSGVWCLTADSLY